MRAFEPLETRRLLAGEILSFHLNARTADDVTALTDTSTRHTEVEVGQIFHLEISYQDLREPGLGETPEFGAYSIGVDVLASLPDAIVPVLTETQRILIGPSIKNAVEGTIDVSLVGIARTTTIDLIDFANSPNLTIKDAVVALGYSPEHIDVSFRSNEEGFMLLEVRYNDVSFAGINLPDLAFDFDVTDAGGDNVAVNLELESVPPVLNDGSINGQALKYNYDTHSRTYRDNQSFYDAINRGVYNPQLGFDEVNGVGELLYLPTEYGVDRSQPFDVLSIPVYINREVSNLELSLNPAERFHSNLVFGSDAALTNDQLEFDPANSTMTVSAKGSIVDSPLRNFYFTAVTEHGGHGLYMSDGNTTRLIRERFDGPDFAPQDLLYAANRLFFTATTNTGEREIYVTDGSEVGTRLLTNISGATGSEPMNLTDAGDRVYFTSVRADGQRELYVTEGDFTSARAVANLSGAISSEPEDLTVIGNKLYFTAINTRSERELYVTDGTRENTRPLLNLHSRFSSEPADITILGDKIVFSANARTGGTRQLYISDGTLGGTVAIASTNPEDLVVLDGKLFFTQETTNGSRVLSRTDGTTAGTVQIMTPNGTAFTHVLESVPFAGELYFVGQDANGSELYSVTSTSTTSRVVRNIAGRANGQPRDLTVVNQRLAFTALLPDGTRELFRTTGTEETTTLVANLYGATSASPESLTKIGNRLAFIATSPTGAKDLYFTDLSRSGTFLIDAALNDDFEMPSDITEANVSKFQIFKNGTGSLNPSTVIPLDANLDGEVSARDALVIVNYLAQINGGESELISDLIDGTPLEASPLDVNRDGSITARDALAVINYLSVQSTQQTALSIDDDDEFVASDDVTPAADEPTLF
ncbi:dockerin type I domain-containing protein [Rubripirellula amarantea]|nr:dockerin type I domain-containing protein [Rubripirellula amarantea]